MIVTPQLFFDEQTLQTMLDSDPDMKYYTMYSVFTELDKKGKPEVTWVQVDYCFDYKEAVKYIDNFESPTCQMMLFLTVGKDRKHIVKIR